MRCPVCPDASLVMSDRQGIEIDYCPKCRGVWLDRGELDKIIERSTQAAPAPAVSPPAHYPPQQQDRYYGKQQGHYRHQKSWLSELFD